MLIEWRSRPDGSFMTLIRIGQHVVEITADPGSNERERDEAVCQGLRQVLDVLERGR